MKKLTVVALTLMGVLWSFRSGAVNSMIETNAESALQLSVGDVLDMNAREFADATGQRLNLKERIVFGMVKGKLKKEVRKGNLTRNDSPAKVVQESSSSFNWVAFLLCVFLSLLGFIIVLLFMDRSAMKSALIGLLVSFLIYGALFI